MAADKSLSDRAQPSDNDAMKPPRPYPVTPVEWLAVLAIWGLVAYGALAHPSGAPRQDQVHLIACRKS
jgi:hypothetical protein